MKNLTLTSIMLLGLSLSCKSQSVTDYLEGTWQVEGKENYETWVKQTDGSLTGEAYKIRNGQKAITETLEIKAMDGRLVYVATVPDQNDAEPVPFTLNKQVDDKWQFENPDHDFPTKIIYKKEGENRLFIEVLGNDDKGFSFYMNRQ